MVSPPRRGVNGLSEALSKTGRQFASVEVTTDKDQFIRPGLARLPGPVRPAVEQHMDPLEHEPLVVPLDVQHALHAENVRPLRLKQILRNVNSHQALVCMFLALLEMVRLQAIQLRQDRIFGEILLRKHTGFDAIVAEQSAVRDDWR